MVHRRMVDRVRLFGMELDSVTLDSAAERLLNWVECGDRRCQYVVTPNLDHAVLFRDNSHLRDAYSSASMVVADGWPLVTAARLLGRSVPERVAGSDLVPRVFEETQRRGIQRSVFLLGAATGVADEAARVIESRWPLCRVVGTFSPPMGFEDDDREEQKIVDAINKVAPDILIVGFGAPKQELWLKRSHHAVQVGVALAAGATIDFFAGRQRRAPMWMRRLRLEWMHRLLQDPRRLTKRYARDAFEFPRLMYREIRSERPLRSKASRSNSV